MEKELSSLSGVGTVVARSSDCVSCRLALGLKGILREQLMWLEHKSMLNVFIHFALCFS